MADGIIRWPLIMSIIFSESLYQVQMTAMPFSFKDWRCIRRNGNPRMTEVSKSFGLAKGLQNRYYSADVIFLLKKKFIPHISWLSFSSGKNFLFSRFRVLKSSKDTEKDLTSGVVYKFQYGLCNQSYFVDCVRHLNVRIGEHMVYHHLPKNKLSLQLIRQNVSKILMTISEMLSIQPN